MFVKQAEVKQLKHLPQGDHLVNISVCGNKVYMLLKKSALDHVFNQNKVKRAQFFFPWPDSLRLTVLVLCRHCRLGVTVLLIKIHGKVNPRQKVLIAC